MTAAKIPFTPRFAQRGALGGSPATALLEEKRLREQGIMMEMREIQQMAQRRIFASRARRREGQLMERERFEEQQEEKQVADAALREGKMSIWMEYKQQKEQARRLAEIDEFKDMYTHAELEKELRKTYQAQHARRLAEFVHARIMEHPETLELLKEKSAIRIQDDRMFIGEAAKRWAVAMGRLRIQARGLIERHEGDLEKIKTGYRAWVRAPTRDRKPESPDRKTAAWAAIAKKRIQEAYARNAKAARPTAGSARRKGA